MMITKRQSKCKPDKAVRLADDGLPYSFETWTPVVVSDVNHQNIVISSLISHYFLIYYRLHNLLLAFEMRLYGLCRKHANTY